MDNFDPVELEKKWEVFPRNQEESNLDLLSFSNNILNIKDYPEN